MQLVHLRQTQFPISLITILKKKKVIRDDHDGNSGQCVRTGLDVVGAVQVDIPF